jgi:hypothetical protein
MNDDTDTARDGRLARIRKLLAQAEDPGATEAEAEAFTAKAIGLMAGYGIDRAMLAAAEPDLDRPGDRMVDLLAPYARDKADLLAGVAHALRCRGVLRVDYGASDERWAPPAKKQLKMHLFGYGSDLARVEILFTSLLVQLANGLRTERIPSYEHVAAYRRAWIAGFAAAVVRRLSDAEQRAAADAAGKEATAPSNPRARSVAVVLASRADVVDSAVSAAYPRLTTAPRRTLSGGGYGGGYAAGRRADLGAGRRSRVGHGREAALPRFG